MSPALTYTRVVCELCTRCATNVTFDTELPLSSLNNVPGRATVIISSCTSTIILMYLNEGGGRDLAINQVETAQPIGLIFFV